MSFNWFFTEAIAVTSYCDSPFRAQLGGHLTSKRRATLPSLIYQRFLKLCTQIPTVSHLFDALSNLLVSLRICIKEMVFSTVKFFAP